MEKVEGGHLLGMVGLCAVHFSAAGPALAGERANGARWSLAGSVACAHRGVWSTDGVAGGGRYSHEALPNALIRRPYFEFAKRGEVYYGMTMAIGLNTTTTI